MLRVAEAFTAEVIFFEKELSSGTLGRVQSSAIIWNESLKVEQTHLDGIV